MTTDRSRQLTFSGLLVKFSPVRKTLKFQNSECRAPPFSSMRRVSACDHRMRTTTTLLSSPEHPAFLCSLIHGSVLTPALRCRLRLLDSGTRSVQSPPMSHMPSDSTAVLADQWRHRASRRLRSLVCMTATCARKLVSLHVAPELVRKATCAYDGEFIDFSCEHCSPGSCARCTPGRMGEPHYSLLHVSKY